MKQDSQKTKEWRALLTGDLAERARLEVEKIARDLERELRSEKPKFLIREPSLASGLAGIAVFFGYLDQAWPRSGYDDLAMECLDRAMDAAGSVVLRPSLYAGFTGVGWAVEHLAGRVFEAGGEDPGEEIDDALAGLLSASSPSRGFELIHGLAGFGVYAVERPPGSRARAELRRIVDHLEESAERRPEGTTWLSPPEGLGAFRQDTHPQGYFDLGVAHGAAGVAGFLAQALLAGEGGVRDVLDEVVSWLLALRGRVGNGTSYPDMIAPGAEPKATRSAWCYGDPGMAAVLTLAAEATGNPQWRQAASEVARLAARRPEHETGVVDAGICHGAFGLAHLFHRMHQATGDPELAAAAHRWYAQGLDMAEPGRGLSGYLAWHRDRQGKETMLGEPGLLIGTAGIGLALLAGITQVEPAWDRMLAISG